jgi:hypothetical protein
MNELTANSPHLELAFNMEVNLRENLERTILCRNDPNHLRSP